MKITKNLSKSPAPVHNWKSFLIEVTNRCNFKCVHCAVVNCDKASLAKPELTYDEICSAIDQIDAIADPLIAFTGGEPFMRKDFWDILKYVKRRNLRATLSTNASLITEEWADKLKKISLGTGKGGLDPDEINSDIAVTVYGMDSKTYDTVTRTKGNYKKAMNGINALLKRDMSVSIRMPLLRELVDQWDDFRATFLNKKGVAYIFPITTIRPTMDGLRTPYEHSLTAKKLEEFFSKNPRYAQPESDYVCSIAKRQSLTLAANGDILPCFNVRNTDMNIRHVSLKEALEKSIFFKKIMKFRWQDAPLCKKCGAIQFCTPCPGVFLLDTGNSFKPGRSYCRVAWAKKRVMDRNKK